MYMYVNKRVELAQRGLISAIENLCIIIFIINVLNLLERCVFSVLVVSVVRSASSHAS